MGNTRYFWLIFALVAVLGLASCGGDDDNNDPEVEVMDTDGDGVLDDADAFPNDASESADSDGDGVGDNADNCGSDANMDQQDSDGDGTGDACEPSYNFTDQNGESTVSYTGQTARHILISDLVTSMKSLQRSDSRTAQEVIDQSLNLYYRNREEATDTDNVLDTQDILFALKNDGDLDDDDVADVQLILNASDADPEDTQLGTLSTGKNLVDKIAGNDKCFHILIDGDDSAACADGERGEFFGWEFGLDADPLVRTPDDLVQFLFGQIAAEATADTQTTIATVDNAATVVPAPTLNAFGHDLYQLVQKFLLGAVTFSQGTADYLSIDFGSASNLALEDGKPYTAGQHDFDEAFGYYGAARNAAEYTDLEARAREGRPAFAQGYNDADGDGFIYASGEIMLGNSTNCAKRDVGATVQTTLTEDAFDGFVAGRQIVQDAGDAGELTAEQATALDAEIRKAAVTWEKCIAATVIHYINDTIGDMNNFQDGVFADLANFTDLAKHWSEMKGFALGLQFSPYSPFRTADSDVDVDTLQMILELMGDAPVLADGTQLGVDYPGGVTGYKADLLLAREYLTDAYGFNAENAKNW